MKVNVGVIHSSSAGGATPARLVPFIVAEAAHERMCWDPKDGSISLSPLYSSSTIDLHVRIATVLHQSFLWLQPPQA